MQLNFLALLLLSPFILADTVFSIVPVTGCVGTGQCLPVVEYRVYLEDGTFVDSSATTEFTSLFSVDPFNPECFYATAYNGLESQPSQTSCAAPDIAAPNAPSAVGVTIVW